MMKMRIPQNSFQCSKLSCENCGILNYDSYFNAKCINPEKLVFYAMNDDRKKWIETPESSNIAKFSYHSDTLTVVFKNGGQYAYFGVPSSIFEGMKGAESKGKFLNTEVKGKFEV
jgi:hypothetical protein